MKKKRLEGEFFLHFEDIVSFNVLFHIGTRALEWGCCNTLKLTDIQRTTDGFWSPFNALLFQVPTLAKN